MEQINLIQQYVMNVSKLLPKDQKDEIASRLTTLIHQKVKEISGSNKADKKVVQSVLEEFGSPCVVADIFLSGERKCLIGGKYYKRYRKVLKIALSIMTFLMIFSSIINIIVTKENWYEAMWDIIFSLMSGNAIAFTVVTILFSKLQQQGK